MLAGTHICLPLILAGVIDWTRVDRGRPSCFTRNDLILIGAGGILPDLFDLHLSLEARHASWSHAIWFPAGLLPLLLVTAIRPWRKHALTFCLAWVGVVLHLAADMVSGGIPLWGAARPIVGRYFIPPPLWWIFDCVLLLVTWYIFFRNRFVESGGKLVSPGCSWEEKILEQWRQDHPPAKAKQPVDPAPGPP